jgi:hypothetical protein
MMHYYENKDPFFFFFSQFMAKSKFVLSIASPGATYVPAQEAKGKLELPGGLFKKRKLSPVEFVSLTQDAAETNGR